jgi:hypothetical protein
MNWISRRRFLAAAAMNIAANRMRAQSTAQVTLTIPAEATRPHVPVDYVGLSYEVQQLVDPFLATHAANYTRAAFSAASTRPSRNGTLRRRTPVAS